MLEMGGTVMISYNDMLQFFFHIKIKKGGVVLWSFSGFSFYVVSGILTYK